MPNQTYKIGTRGSKLALTQSNYIKNLLNSKYPEISFEIVIIKTSGDIDRVSSLESIGGFGLFTKQIETELLEKRVDVAIHSAKDLPSVMTAGLAMGAVPAREKCEDAWISRNGSGFLDISPGCVIGTSSPRRKAMLLNKRNDLKFKDMRGNIETRLKKLGDGECDAIVMALAGLNRLGLQEKVVELLPPDEFIPAPGQGALAVQIRADDDPLAELLKAIDNPETHRCLDIERLLLAQLNAGCSAAVGGLSFFKGSHIELISAVLDKTGQTRIYAEDRIVINESDDKLVSGVTEQLFAQGAREIIEGYES